MRHPHVTDTAAAALLAIAHGSRDPRAALTTAKLLDLVRRRAARHGLAGLQAATAYLGHAAPSPSQVLGAMAGSGARTVIALPLLLSDAYHSKTDIPAMLHAARATLPNLQILCTPPLGPHPLLIRAMERRLAQVGVRPGDPGTAVVVAAAGSSSPTADAAIRHLARDWQARRGWHAVVPAFASAASPTPAQAVSALRSTGAAHIAVASYLLAPGVLADHVRNTSLAAGASTVSAVLGAAPELADLILHRYAAAANEPHSVAARPA